jgi:hypothetical protein
MTWSMLPPGAALPDASAATVCAMVVTGDVYNINDSGASKGIDPAEKPLGRRATSWRYDEFIKHALVPEKCANVLLRMPPIFISSMPEFVAFTLSGLIYGSAR